MRKITAAMLLLSVLLCGCAGKGGELEPWTAPAIEAAPTPTPKAAVGYSGESLPPESYIWNEAVSFNMSDPGVQVAAEQETFNHSGSFEVFGGQFLPKTIFNESYSPYSRLYLEQIQHQILLDAYGQLPPNAYVEYRYLNKAWVESKSITVMAELCSYEQVMDVYARKLYPHISYGEGVTPQTSVYYLQSFVLSKIGDTRYAQWLVLPTAYFSYVEKARAIAEDKGEEPVLQRQVLLTFTCREDVSDEEFIAAVCAIGKAAAAERVLPSASPVTTLAPGDKGYA